MSKRLAFKCYRSYFDVAMQLDDKERLKFYDALMKRQFLGEEPNLIGMSNFAYISQKHSIDLQVKGFEDKTKNKLSNPIEPPYAPPIEPPYVQEKEKEKEKEKEVVNAKADKIDFDALLIFINKTFGRNFRKVSNQVKAKYNARLKDGFTKEDFKTAIINCSKLQFHKDNNFQYCTPEYFSRAEILDKYSDVTSQEEQKIYDPLVEAMNIELERSKNRNQ
jgi:uncharacterized phage protein (TIGR02220 family)